MADETFGDRLKRHRWAMGLSLRKLGKQAGLDYSYVARLEQDERRPSPETVARLAGALNLPDGSVDRDRLYLAASFVPPGVPVERLLLTCQMARRRG